MLQQKSRGVVLDLDYHETEVLLSILNRVDYSPGSEPQFEVAQEIMDLIMDEMRVKPKQSPNPFDDLSKH